MCDARLVEMACRKVGRRMTYKVWVCLEAEYDDIEADSEEEAFLIASEAAMSGGSWDWIAERREE